MVVQGKKDSKDLSKQLLLVLLFVLACLLLSTQVNRVNTRMDSGLDNINGVFTVPYDRGTVFIGEHLMFVPNIDYTDIDNGSFVYDDYHFLPYASNVTVSTSYGWRDLGPQAEWHNCTHAPASRIIARDGKLKTCGTYLMTFKFDNPNMIYYLSIPNTNGLVKVYCNGKCLGALWGRTDEWSPVIRFGYGYLPIIPDRNGYAQIMISISTHQNFMNPGILSLPSLTPADESIKDSVVPSLWMMIQILLFLFVLIGGFLISKTFKNRSVFFLLISVEMLALAFTLIDSNFIVLTSYVREIAKFILYILINTAVFIFIDAFFLTSSIKSGRKLFIIAPIIVMFASVFLILWALTGTPTLDGLFPLVPEVLFIASVAMIGGANMLTFHYGEDLTFFATIIIVCQVFFGANSLSNINCINNIPTYSIFFVIANITLEFYFVLKYVIQARTLEDTMEHMQFLVQEKTLRISEINKDLFNTNKKLMENETARKNVLSNVSHDLRTPITAIRGYAEILLSPSANMNEAQRENYLRNIIRRAEQMERIISDIVELTRLESNASEFQFTDISLTEMLDEICMMYEADLNGTQKRLVVDLPEDDLLFIKADPKKLSRVFENLISNAINYTYEEARIEVKAWRSGLDKPITQQTVNIDISDNGIGIPENEVPMIFDRFYRAKNSGQNIKGTGIGLSIVKTIIDRHNAVITVESAIGKGTRFHIEMKAS